MRMRQPLLWILVSLSLLLHAPSSAANDLPLWVKCAAGLAHLVGRGYRFEQRHLVSLNEKLTAEGRSESRVREAFENVVQPRIRPARPGGFLKFLHVGLAESATVTYAYGTYPGAEPPLIALSGPGGKRVYTALEGASVVSDEVAASTLWPLVVRDRRIIPADAKLPYFLKTKDTMIALGKSGQGPEVVSWGIQRESENDPKARYVLRVVTKNLEYGDNVFAAGTLPALSYTLSQLSPAQQKLAARLFTEQACYHPDPHVGNSYLVIRRTEEGGLELKPYYVDVDGGLGLLRPSLPGSNDKTVAGRADIFRRLQERVLSYFPQNLSDGRLVFRATELLGDTPDHRAIDAILFPNSLGPHFAK